VDESGGGGRRLGAVTYRHLVKAQEVLDAMLEGLKRDMLRFQAGRGD